MKLDFLAAADGTPLTKTFTKNANGELVRSDYPRVWRFNSIRIEVASLKELATSLRTAAKAGQCMLKGVLDEPLIDTSRAGHTQSDQPTDWICLDIDGVPGMTIDAFMKAINLADVSHVRQFSASSGVVKDRGLSAHVFVQLTKPVRPAVLKVWLMHLNLSVPALRAACRLTRTANAVRWALDVSTCQNDKLIYIAPPLLGKGVKSTLKPEDRIVAISGAKHVFDFEASTSDMNTVAVDNEHKKLLNELRAVQGLPKRDLATRVVSGVEVMTKPGKSVVSDVRRERGFAYLNLNGGDSWGYYHPLDNPEILYNFKGEPAYLIKQLLPEYYAQVAAEMRPTGITKAQDEAEAAAGINYLAFLDPKSDTYYRGTYRAASEEEPAPFIAINATKALKKLQDFLVAHGQPQAEFVPEWDYDFRPDIKLLVDPATRFVNRFWQHEMATAAEPTAPQAKLLAPLKASPKLDIPPAADEEHRETSSRPEDAQLAARYREMRSHMGTLEALCPRIYKVIAHLCVDHIATIDHLVNWIGAIYIHQCRTNTAWVFSGTEGTGKGTLYYQVIQPLLGERHCVAVNLAAFEEKFNEFLSQTLYVFVDETTDEAVNNVEALMQKLRNNITERTIPMRGMGKGTTDILNFNNFSFASNYDKPLPIRPGDRRFNITPNQQKEHVIQLTELPLIRAEVPLFATYLQHYPVSTQRAGAVIKGAARDHLVHLSRSSIDTVTDALNKGNLEFFIDQLPQDNAPSMSNDNMAPLRVSLVRDLLKTAGRYANGPKAHRISREELRTLFEYVVGKIPETPNKFSSYIKHHGIQMSRHRLPVEEGGEVIIGIAVNWHATEETLQRLEPRKPKPAPETAPATTEKVVPIKRNKAK